MPTTHRWNIVEPPAGQNGRGHKSQARQVSCRRAKIDADREKRRADMKAFNKTTKRREAERKAYDKKMMAEWEAE
jgi:hypothetical protein